MASTAVGSRQEPWPSVELTRVRWLRSGWAEATGPSVVVGLAAEAAASSGVHFVG